MKLAPVDTNYDEAIPDCDTCENTGWILCDHVDTPRDADGWCERCSTPGDLKIDGKVRTWCHCQP